MLIADDNPQLLEILKVAAQREGFQVLLARDGEETLSVFRRHQPQMLLLDNAVKFSYENRSIQVAVENNPIRCSG